MNTEEAPAPTHLGSAPHDHDGELFREGRPPLGADVHAAQLGVSLLHPLLGLGHRVALPVVGQLLGLEHQRVAEAVVLGKGCVGVGVWVWVCVWGGGYESCQIYMNTTERHKP